jgi:ABC-type uncharacterized transport system substrate-binding protein
MDQGGGKRRSDTPTVSQEALASHPFAALLRRIAGLIHLRVFPRLFNFINSVNRCGRSCGMLRRHFELTERHVLEGEEHIAGLTIEVQSLEVRAADDFDGVFEVVRKQRPDALITVEDPLTFNYQKRIAVFALANQLPSLHGVREFAVAGGLMSYGANVADVYRRAASYVDKILKGANPADLPVQQPTKFELVINLQTAEKLGLRVSPLLLARADEVIE